MTKNYVTSPIDPRRLGTTLHDWDSGTNPIDLNPLRDCPSDGTGGTAGVSIGIAPLIYLDDELL